MARRLDAAGMTAGEVQAARDQEVARRWTMYTPEAWSTFGLTAARDAARDRYPMPPGVPDAN